MSTRSFTAPPAKATRSRGPPIYPRESPPVPPRRCLSVSSVVKPAPTMATDAPAPAVTTQSGTSTSSSSVPSTAGQSVVHDSSLAPPPFKGDGSDSPTDWLQYFQKYVAFKQLPEVAALPLFALLMRGPANIWFTTLTDEVRNDYGRVLDAFHAKYDPTPTSLWKRASDFWSRDQKSTESVEVYVSDMMKRASECHAADDMTRYAIIKGLRPEICAYVLQQAPTSTAALMEAAKIAEDTVALPTTSLTEEVLEAIRRLETRSTASVGEQRRQRSPSPFRYRSTSGDRRVRFQDELTTSAYQPSYTAPVYPSPYGRQPWRPWPSSSWQSMPYAGTAPVAAATAEQPRRDSPRGPRGRARVDFTARSRRPPSTTRQPSRDVSGVCGNCGRAHQTGDCAARGQVCRNCHKRNHLARCCRSTSAATTRLE